MKPSYEDKLSRAQRHVVEGEHRVAQQTALIERLVMQGLDARQAHALLETMLDVLKLMRDDLKRLESLYSSE